MRAIAAASIGLVALEEGQPAAHEARHRGEAVRRPRRVEERAGAAVEKPVIVTRSVSTFSSASASARSASTAAPGSSSHHIPFAWGKRASTPSGSRDERAVWAVGRRGRGRRPRMTTSGKGSSPR